MAREGVYRSQSDSLTTTSAQFDQNIKTSPRNITFRSGGGLDSYYNGKWPLYIHWIMILSNVQDMQGPCTRFRAKSHLTLDYVPTPGHRVWVQKMTPIPPGARGYLHRRTILLGSRESKRAKRSLAHGLPRARCGNEKTGISKDSPYRCSPNIRKLFWLNMYL